MSVWSGQDFPIDLNLVERIEIVRGPSALYGSSGVLATINVVTYRPADVKGTTVRVETGGEGERKITTGGSFTLGKGASLLLSTSIFNDTGSADLYFTEFDSPATNFGHAINMDGVMRSRTLPGATGKCLRWLEIE
jgi:outer membrane receptor for ferrienterochelin and colicins